LINILNIPSFGLKRRLLVPRFYRLSVCLLLLLIPSWSSAWAQSTAMTDTVDQAPSEAQDQDPATAPAQAEPAQQAAPASQTGSEDGGIMVWRLEVKTGVSENDIDSLSGIITAEVERLSGRKVIAEADILTILRGEKVRQQCGVQESGCLAEIGAALGVPEVVAILAASARSGFSICVV
jgi:hypothetical protein